MSDDDKTLDDRLIDAMADMVNPKKNASAYNYKYEQLDQVLGIVRPALLSHGIGLTQRQARCDAASCYVLQTIVFDGSSERLLDERVIRDMPDAQKAGSWETYMRRYALRTVFGLCGEDDDGAATVGGATHEVRAKPARASRAKSNTPKSDMDAAKVRLAKACDAYAEKHGADAGKIKAGINDRQDYSPTVEFYTRAAEEFESEL